MALPVELVTMIKSVPTRHLDELCKMVKTEKLTSKMIIEAFEKGDKIALKRIYVAISPILLVGGLMPGVGLACNIIDCAFCFVVGEWLSFVIDLIAIALFEVPGVAGLKPLCKGLLASSKHLLGYSLKIGPKAVKAILKKLSNVQLLKPVKVHEMFSVFMSPELKVFVDVDAIAKTFSRMSNPFLIPFEISAKVVDECAKCGVKVKAAVAPVVKKTQTSILKTNENFFNVTMKSRIIDKGIK